MKKRIIAILTVCFLLMSSFAAYADIIVEPENDFYSRHKSHIIFLGRSFSANGADGFASVRKEPDAKKEIAKLQNGEVTYVQYSCLYDGDLWGFTFEHNGWIKMDQFLVLYDYVAFEEDHLDEFYDYSGDYAGIKESRSAIAWPWPGAEAPVWTFADLDIDSLRAFCAYKDDEGREWGFITYLYGSRNVWICLSDPLNRDIPVFNPAPAPAVWVSETFHNDIWQYVDSQKNESSMIVVIIVLVAVLVLGTAVLIRVFWKPDKNEPGGNGDE